MTHRFHPLFGRDYEFVVHGRNWGEDRVYYRAEVGRLFFLPAGWTDVVGESPFAVMAAGRCPFAIDGLLALAALVDGLCSQPGRDRDIKRIMP